MSPEAAPDAASARDSAILEALAIIISLLDNLEDIAAALDRIAGNIEGQAIAATPAPGRHRPRRVYPPLPNRRDRS